MHDGAAGQSLVARASETARKAIFPTRYREKSQIPAVAPRQQIDETLHWRKRAHRMSPAIEDDIEHLVPSGKITWMFTDYSGDPPFADHKTPGELDDVTGLGIAVHIDTNGAAPGRCAATVRLSLHMT